MRSQEEIETHIKQVLDEEVAPNVAMHGGQVNFVSYENGLVMLELSGACSGCAGSTMTLKYGVEQVLTEKIPEVNEIDAFDDPMSMVDPFYTDPFWDMQMETIDFMDITDEPDNK
jgi:Fe-S cluster biogenesis protein NfuA